MSKKHNITVNKPKKANNLNKLPLYLILIFDLVVMALLATVYANYLRKIEGLSIFLPTQMFYDDCMQIPGGVISWMSAFITQSLYYPWAGAAVFVALLMIIQLLWGRVFGIGKQLSALVLIPSLLITLAFTNLGYLIFTLRPTGCFMSLSVGIIAVLAIFGIYRLLPRWWMRYVMIVAIVILGYHLLGFYALLAAAMCAVSTVRSSGINRYAIIIMAALLIGIFPNIWFTYVGNSLMKSQTYLSGIPYFYKSETGWWALYISIYALLLICAALNSNINNIKAIITRVPYWQPGICAVAVIALMLLHYSDRNFMHTLDLDRAILNQDWQKAVELTESYDGNPDRLNTILGYIALRRTGLSADRMFAVKYGWEPYNTSRDIRPMHDAAGALVSYHLGLINYANRWCMEYNIGQGMSIERIMLLAKCALLNYELPLAKTYLDIVYNTPFRRDWAKRYLRYVSNPVEMNSDPELSAIRQLMCHENQFINDGGAFESYIWPMLASANTGTQDFNDLCMQAALLTRDLEAFMPRLQSYIESNRRIPIHYQEAALLWAVMNNVPCPPFVDRQTIDRHNQFLNVFRSLSRLEAEKQRDMMKESFGNTYWYYYIFTENQQAI